MRVSQGMVLYSLHEVVPLYLVEFNAVWLSVCPYYECFTVHSFTTDRFMQPNMYCIRGQCGRWIMAIIKNMNQIIWQPVTLILLLSSSFVCLCAAVWCSGAVIFGEWMCNRCVGRPLGVVLILRENRRFGSSNIAIHIAWVCALWENDDVVQNMVWAIIQFNQNAMFFLLARI